MQTLLTIIAGIGATIVLIQLARVAWYMISTAALWLHVWLHRYEYEVEDRLKRYV